MNSLTPKTLASLRRVAGEMDSREITIELGEHIVRFDFSDPDQTVATCRAGRPQEPNRGEYVSRRPI